MLRKMKVAVTQFLRPNGCQQALLIEVDDEVGLKAQQIAEAGFRFQVEILTTGHASFTVSDDWDDYAFEIHPNSTDNEKWFAKLVMDFDIEAGVARRNTHFRQAH